MNIVIKDINISYIMFGSGKDILLLHGWGQNKEMMLPIGKKLDNFRITILDLPGFGSSSEPTTSYDIYEYTEIIHEFVEKLGLKNPLKDTPEMDKESCDKLYQKFLEYAKES